MSRKLDYAVKKANQSRKSYRSDVPMLAGVRQKSQSDKGSLRVWGPYQEGPSSFRLKVAENGVQRSIKFRTQEEAERVKDELHRKYTATNRKTVAEALPEWVEETTPNVKPRTIANYTKMLARLPQSLAMAQLAEEEANKLYHQQIERVSLHTGRKVSTATQHLFLWVVRHFWIWAINKGYAKVNPWMKVRRVGKANVGKPQLRIDEARKLEAVAMQRADAGDVPALGVLLMLYLGLRQGEVAARVARDIDDDGRVLWVPSGKTKNARRRLKIPDQIRPLVLARIEGTQSGKLIFYPNDHKRFHHEYYKTQLARLCKLAGVPVVCPHSLRGMHATLALEGGATGDAVAKALGHGSFEMTKAHYASPSSVANSEAGRVAAALAGNSLEKELLKLLKSVPANQLMERLQTMRSRCRSAEDIEENGIT